MLTRADLAIWAQLVDQAAMAAQGEPRSLSHLYDTARLAQQSTRWPGSAQVDEYLCGALVRLAWAFAFSGEARRALLAFPLATLANEVERLLPPAPAVDPTPSPSPPPPVTTRRLPYADK